MQEDGFGARDLARLYLRDKAAFVHPRIPLGNLERMVSACGAGADHVAGEEVLAVVAHSQAESAGCLWMLGLLNPVRFLVRQAVKSTQMDWEHGAILTDRRAIVRDMFEMTEAPYASLVEVSRTGATAGFFGWESMVLRYADGKGKSMSVPGRKMLARYLNAILDQQAADEGLLDGPRAGLPDAGPDDPAALDAVSAALDQDDPRAKGLLAVLRARVDAGDVMEPEARELARRVLLWSRTTTGGRGSRDGWWISVLRPFALSQLVGSIVGKPVPAADEEAGVQCWEFPRDAELGKAIAVSAFLLLAGAGKILLSKGDLRLRIREEDSYTLYRFEEKGSDGWENLSESNGKLVHELHNRMLWVESRVLLRRCLEGDEGDPNTRFDAPTQALGQALAAHAPDVRLAWYDRARPTQELQPFVRPEDMPQRARLRGLSRRLRHLPSVPTGAVPVGVSTIGAMNIVLGVLQSLAAPIMTCCGLGALWSLPLVLILDYAGVPRETVSELQGKGILFQAALTIPHGLIMVLFGSAFLKVPKKTRWLMTVLSVANVLSFCVGGILPAIAGMVSLGCLAAKDVRAFFKTE